MLTRAIFIQPDCELIRESVCACANLLNCLLIEEHVLKSNRGSTKTLTAFCSEHFISIKHRILTTFNIHKKIQF